MLQSGARPGAVCAVTLEQARILPWAGARWTVAAACGSLKGGRADWLVEKASELGAFALLPLLCERSPAVGRGDAGDTATGAGAGADDGSTGAGGQGRSGGGRGGRWERLAVAASKQCLRPHALRILPPLPVAQLAAQLRDGSAGAAQARLQADAAAAAWARRGRSGGAWVGEGRALAQLALLATAGAPPMAEVLSLAGGAALRQGGLLIVGPEGDFTAAEKEALLGAGARAAGLGPLRLRVETAAMAALALAVLWQVPAEEP